MAKDDPTASAEGASGYATDTESRLADATASLSTIAGGLCTIHRLANMALCTGPSDPDGDALLVAIRDLARHYARTLDKCTEVIVGGPAVGCFADDLAAE